MRQWLRVLACGFATLLFAHTAADANAQTQPAATATLRDPTGKPVATAEFREQPDQVLITLLFSTNAPLSGTHAAHIHERGRCDPPDFTSAGNIFNPLGKQHGLLNPDGPMVGDLPDLVLGSTGLVHYSVAAPQATLRPGPASLLGPGGTALVLDAGSDDNKTQPLGNSGAYIACGVVLAPGQADPFAGNAAPTISPIFVGIVGLVVLAIGIALRWTGVRGITIRRMSKGLHKEGHVIKARYRSRKFVAMGVALSLVLVTTAIGQAQTGANITQPVGADWPVVGGNLGNTRYSSLDQINTANVSGLKAAWMIHLGSGLSTGTPPYTLEATPIVQDGVMYMSTGADDIYALDPKTGALIWEYRSGLDPAINTACCGWDNRGVAVANGLVYVGRLDGAFMALDAKTGHLEWQTQVGRWQDGYTITAAPLYYNGVIYTGISGAEYGVRGKLTALDAGTGQELWHFWTIPGPGDIGGDTWPSPNDPDPVKAAAYLHGGATIWQHPSIDPELGLIYFSTGNAGPDYDGSSRPGDNLFSVSMVALHLNGTYAWHFQQVHHDIWDFDSPSPTVLYDTTANGQPVKAIAEASKTGWVYMLDRTNGKPIVGMDEKPVQQIESQANAATQPFPVGDALIPQCAEQVVNWISACIFDSFGKVTPKLFAPKNGGGVVFAPMSYDPQTNALYVTSWVSPSAGIQGSTDWVAGRTYTSGGVSPPILGAHKYGTLTAMNASTNKIMWQVKNDYTTGQGSGFLTTAGGIAFHGNSDGFFQAYAARTGDLLWQWQTGAGADAPAMTYSIDGTQYVTIAAGGLTANGVGSQRSDMLWTFALNGASKLQQMPKPTQLPVIVTGFTGAIVQGTTLTPPNKVTVADFGYTPNRIQIKAGDTITFANNGPTPHTATASDGTGWDTGLLDAGASASFTFEQPGQYTYLCTPHPFMVGQILVADASGNVPNATPGSEPGLVHP